MSKDTYIVGDEKDLYQKREKIYPKMVSGRFQKWRTLSVWLLLGLYYGTPWLTWGDRQAILFDLPARKFHILGITFWPQDFIFLTLLLIIAALALFFFTAIAGRLWCGYACPQTVWTQAFVWMERLVEGDRNQQIKLDKAPWTAKKIVKKSIKHSLWIVFAFFTGYTFVGYFTPIKELSVEIINLQTGPWETFWVLFYSFATWGNAGRLREQVCIYMCPYARFQSAMFDKDTLIIAYDADRGESRGSRKRGQDYQASGLGDCIDCYQCVHVCPTGIDIRDGLQHECIACAACIDACDNIMDKMNYPKGLIRYTSQNKEEGAQTQVIRLRTILYAGLIVVVSGLFLLSLWFRMPLELDIIKDRNRLYLTNSEGMIENVYKLRVLNKDQAPHDFAVQITGLKQAQLQAPSKFSVPAGGVLQVPVRVSLDPYFIQSSSNEIEFTITSLDNPELTVSEPARFIGPVPKRRR